MDINMTPLEHDTMSSLDSSSTGDAGDASLSSMLNLFPMDSLADGNYVPEFTFSATTESEMAQSDQVLDSSLDTTKKTTAKTTTKTSSRRTKRKVKDEMNQDEKKMQRMLKNREIARNCRKRKRERMQLFEREVVRLREVNRQLELKLNRGKEGKDREQIRQVKLERIKTLLQTIDKETANKPAKAGRGQTKKSSAVVEIQELMARYAEMYSDFGNERKIAIKFHLESLQSLLVPTQVSKMLFWTLGQKDEAFYNDKQPENQNIFGGGVWNMICQSCQFTPDQKKKMLKTRGAWEAERKKVGECLGVLKGLESKVDGNFLSLRRQMNSLMKITSPAQQARFLLWIEENQACMHMLNNLWLEQINRLKAEAKVDIKDEQAA